MLFFHCFWMDKGLKDDIEIKLEKSRVIDSNWIENYTATTGEDFVMREFLNTATEW